MGNRKEIECHLCGKSAEIKSNGFPGYQEPEKFKIIHCPHCNTSYSSPILVDTTNLYERIYRLGKKVPGYDRYWKYAQAVRNKSNPLNYLAETEETYWAIKKALEIKVRDKNDTKILEIGSGLGYLTFSLIKENYKVVGLDISNTAIKQATEKFGNYYICADLNEYSKSNKESFDLVILTEVIEHISKPIEFVNTIKTLLKPKGSIIITTPNKSVHPSHSIWQTELPPVHFWWFSEESMKYIAKSLKFNLTFINFLNCTINGYRQSEMKVNRGYELPVPILNINGELIRNKVNIQNRIKQYANILIEHIPYFKRLYRRIKMQIMPNHYVSSDRGIILCAIFQI